MSNTKENKLILADCDGVLLAWEWYFDRWMHKHGFTKRIHDAYSTCEAYGISEEQGGQLVRMFNETVYAGNLPPLRDALKYVRKLHEEYGCIFHVISSISGEPEIAEARKRNLRNVFGSSVFYKITCLDPSVSKLVVLNEYADSGAIWVEDVVHNYRLGEQLNLHPILITHSYNELERCSNRVYNWASIYEIVTDRIEKE
jgi:hypothetical protein